MTTRGRRRWQSGGLACLTVVAFAAVGSPASAASFTISGTVRSSSAAPVADVCVDVRDATSGQQVGTTTSASDGTYAVSVPSGSYHVFFDPQCHYLTIPYTWQWWAGTTDPTEPGTIVVASDTPLIDAALQPGGSLSGSLTDQHGQPAVGVCVKLYDPARTYTYSPYALDDGRPTLRTTSDASGHYRFDGLASTAYQVVYGADCKNTWSIESYPAIDGVPAQPVSVTAPAETTGVDATVARATTLSGRLTWTADGSPIGNVMVDAQDLSTDSVTGGLLHTASTASDGTYSIPNLSRGTYTLRFYANMYGPLNPPPPDVAMTVYSATGDRSMSTPVTVDGDPVTGIDMALPRGGHVTGHVTGPDGSPLSGIIVDEWSGAPRSDAAATTSVTAWTDASGNYDLAGLPNETNVTVRFSDRSGRFPDQLYPATLDVTTGQTVSGIDVQMHNGGELKGRVVDANGLPVAGAIVHLPRAGMQPRMETQTVTTDASGAWFVDGLGSGGYQVWAEAPSRPDTAARYLPSAADPADAETVSLSAGEVKGVEDIKLGAAGHVIGTVVDPTGIPLANVCVTAHEPTRQAFAGSDGTATTDDTGHYDVGGLNTGSYVVHFAPCPGLLAGSVFHGGAVVQANAATVDVTNGAVTAIGVDRLPDGGDISGTVTSSADSANAYVTAESDTGERRTVRTASDGSYRITGLTAGHWRVHFQGCPQAHSTYYKDAESASDATPVDVVAKTVTTDISANLTWLGDASDDSCRAAPPPGSLKAHVVDATTVLLTWTRPPDAAAALLEYQIDIPMSYAQGFYPWVVPADDTEALITGLAPRTYGFTVRALYPGTLASDKPVASTAVAVGDPPDRTPPTVSMHTSRLTVAPRAGVSWEGNDASGVASYDLEWAHRTVAGPLGLWTPFPGGSGTTAQHTTFNVAPGYVYCLRVRARDFAGNLSGWNAPSCTMRPVDDAGMRASAGWTASHPQRAYLQTVRATEVRGATLSVPVRHVNMLYVLTYLCPACGSVDVSLGGVHLARLQLVSRYPEWTMRGIPLGGSRSGVVTMTTTSSKLVDIDGLGALAA